MAKRSKTRKLQPGELARNYIRSRFPSRTSRTLLSFLDDFYIFREGKWKSLPTIDLENNVHLFLQNSSNEDHGYDARTSLNDVMRNIKSLVAIPSTSQVPFDLVNNKHLPNLLFVANGIIDLNSTVNSGAVSMIEATPRYFSVNYLPVSYNASTEAITFKKVLNEALEAPEVNFLQEWFGYHLHASTKHQKMVLFVGDGADGKSVICLVLREMLGAHNISSVGLEALSAERTFPLSAIYGKMANIVEDMSEISKVSEGILKKLVSGDAITFERKHRDPVTGIFSAKLTFATNVLPQFNDKSSGIWRRLILLQFKNQILDESKQNKSLIEPTFWRSSDELSGVLNWAIEGLIRLEKNKQFSIPESSKVAVTEYKKTSNPTAEFLQENYTKSEGSIVASIDLYCDYSFWMKARGYLPLGHNQFNNEVRRVFSQVRLSKNARRVGKSRNRIWEGLALLKD